MEITKEMIAGVLGGFFQRCEAARMVGGIALRDVVESGKPAPAGYWFDDITSFYIPGNATLPTWEIEQDSLMIAPGGTSRRGLS